MMQDIVLRVFVVAALGLMHLRDEPTLDNVDDEILKDHEKKLLTEADKLEQETTPAIQETIGLQNTGTQADGYEKHNDSTLKVAQEVQTAGFRDAHGSRGQRASEGEESLTRYHMETPHNQTSCSDLAEHLWYIWNMLSIISIICFFRKYSQSDRPSGATAAAVPLPDSATLQHFHAHFIQVKKWREEEFLEGIVSDLLEAMRSTCDGRLVLGDFQMVDSWHVIVPFTPPKPFRFQCLLQNQTDNLQPACQIKLLENEGSQNSCPCQASGAADDTVCLLHHENEDAPADVTDACKALCIKNTTFLSRLQVTKWFRNTLRQAWAPISHKYQFDLVIRNTEAPGELLVRFRSGKKIHFSISPVVMLDSDLFATPASQTDVTWMLSAAVYEDRLFDLVAGRLPADSCHMQTLEVAQFLHRRQTALSGRSAVKSFHFKAALLHLLLTTAPPQWRPEKMTDRLRDLLAFMERSLEKKLLQQVLIGNPLSQRIIDLPPAVTQAKPVNIFHPLVEDDCIYTTAVKHFQEILRNANMLINDYVGHYDAASFD